MLFNELMIDIETTGQKPGCKVLSLGAFGFNKDGNQVEFYRRFSVAAQQQEWLNDEPSTMEFWKRQSNEAYAQAFGGTTKPDEGLAQFKQFLYGNFTFGKDSAFRVWCCGLDFDFPILSHFMGVYGFKFPWLFWHQYDYRTIKNLFPLIVKEAEGNTFKHNALEDATAQMRGLRAFLEWKPQSDE